MGHCRNKQWGQNIPLQITRTTSKGTRCCCCSSIRLKADPSCRRRASSDYALSFHCPFAQFVNINIFFGCPPAFINPRLKPVAAAMQSADLNIFQVWLWNLGDQMKTIINPLCTWVKRENWLATHWRVPRLSAWSIVIPVLNENRWIDYKKWPTLMMRALKCP